MSRPQTRERPPPAHRRGSRPPDPLDLAVPAIDRLISARAVLTRYVRAVDLLEAYEASKVERITNPLYLPDAPHAQWARKFKKSRFVERTWDQDELDQAERLVGRDTHPSRADARTGRAGRRASWVWPAHVTYGPETWIQLRWKPYWLLDQGQKWMDRFELGESWWQDIYDRFPTERDFDRWRNDLQTGHRGVIWSASTDPLEGPDPRGDRDWDGRLEEPTLAFVVVSSTRRPRRTARWPLFLPNLEWPAEMRAKYVDRRYAGEGNWRSLSAELDAFASGAVTDVEALAQSSLSARINARRNRRG